jgi:uncharacterized membrane protein (DUF4010 family)
VWLLGRSAASENAPDAAPRNPLELGMALQFAVLLAVVLLLATWLRDRLGNVGVLLAAAIAGVSDVDAPMLSVAALLDHGLPPATAALAIGIAVASNTLAKAVLSAVLGGRAVAMRISAALLVMLIAGAAGLVGSL